MWLGIMSTARANVCCVINAYVNMNLQKLNKNLKIYVDKPDNYDILIV